jgi:large subunit ribosomal protein L16
MKRAGRVWIRIFPDVPVTSKPTEVRMGKGKGSVDYWAAKVKPGRIMFEIDGVSEDSPAKPCASARRSFRSRPASYSASQSKESDHESRRCSRDERRPTQ